MTAFTLHLQDAKHYERIEGVTSFVGEDASGRFGLLAGHERMMTSLTFGLMRYRVGAGDWEYVAVPGGILYFIDNELYLSARSYYRDSDYRRITAVLGDQLQAEEETLQTIKQSLHRMEEEMLKRLSRMGRGAWERL